MAKAKSEEKFTLQSKMEDLNRRYGVGTVLSLNDREIGEYEVIPTGSVGFDKGVLGVGGFVLGRMYEIRGWEGHGKSTVCGHIVGEAQKKYPNKKVLYIDGEFSLDKIYFEALGVNTDSLLICQPNNGEEGFTVAQEMIATGELSLCIIDSDSSLIPKSVLEGEIGVANIGKKAKLNSDAYPKLKGELARQGVCVIVTSQYRQNPGMMFGDPKVTQGGKALGFYADCIVEISKKLKKDDDFTSGNITTVKTIKNKTYAPFKSATFDVIFGLGIDKTGEILELGADMEIYKKWGNSITYNENKYTIEDFRQLLEDNPFFKDEMIEKIKEKL